MSTSTETPTRSTADVPAVELAPRDTTTPTSNAGGHQGSLPKTMRAVVAYAPGDYRLEIVPVPECGPDDIIVKVEACGICAGDIKANDGAASFWGGNGQPKYIKSPMIPGHEFLGHAVAIGDNVVKRGKFKIGDRIISEQIVPCWDCRFCLRGEYWMCEKHDVYGFQNNVNGGFAEYMRYPKEAINHLVPKEIPLEKAILVEPYACSVFAVKRAKITLEDVVVLAGAGPLGLGMVGAMRLHNPSKLVVLDVKQDRLDLAKKYGADVVLNPLKDDVVKIVKDMTGGYGCDVYVEATGHPDSVKQGLNMIRKLGRFVEFSVFSHDVTVDWSIISDRKMLDILGAHLGPYCYPFTIEAIGDGRLPTEGVVTHQLPLEKFKEGMELMKKGDKSIKVLLIP